MQASVPQAKANLSKLLEAVARGKQGVMTRLQVSSPPFRQRNWTTGGPCERIGEADRADGDGLDLLPLSPSAALAAALLDWDHRDPFDRMIAGVVRQEDLLLLSADAAFDGLGVERLWG